VTVLGRKEKVPVEAVGGVARGRCPETMGGGGFKPKEGERAGLLKFGETGKRGTVPDCLPTWLKESQLLSKKKKANDTWREGSFCSQGKPRREGLDHPFGKGDIHRCAVSPRRLDEGPGSMVNNTPWKKRSLHSCKRWKTDHPNLRIDKSKRRSRV